jgi:hypothetical protein
MSTIDYSLDSFSQVQDVSVSVSPVDYLFDAPVNVTTTVLFDNKDTLNLSWTSRLVTPQMLNYDVVYEFDTVADMIHVRNARLQSIVTDIEFKQTMSVVNLDSNQTTFLATVTIKNGFNEFTGLHAPYVPGGTHALLIDDISVRLSTSDSFVALYENDLPKRVEHIIV